MDIVDTRRVFEYSFEQMQLVDTPTQLTLTLQFEPDVGRGCVRVRHCVEDLISEDTVAAGAIILIPGTVESHLRTLFAEWLISNQRAARDTSGRSGPF